MNGLRSKARPRIIFICEECGQDFEGYTFVGTSSRYCRKCNSKRLEEFEAEQTDKREQSLAYRHQEWLSDSIRGIPRRYCGLSWEDFNFDRGGEENRGKVEELREYAKNFPVEKMPFGIKSLLITREVNGVGKTLLACLILQDIIHRYEQMGRERCPFQFWPVGRLKQRLRAAERFGGPESVEDVYRDFATMWLLVLDDVGKEKLEGADAAFTFEMYYTIINERYNAQLPIILTSNLSLDPWRPKGLSLADLMGRAGVSRLMEMTLGTAYVIEGEDRR